MLLEFKVKNYKSFKEELVFSLIPAPKQKGLDYSILEEKIGKKIYKGLSAAVIYGANASGKTNIIGAMDTFKNILLRGNIHNDENNKTPNVAASNLELIPNNTLTEIEPVHFYIKFIEKNLLIEYELTLDLGLFLETDYKRKVIKETLSINDSMLFNREDNLEIGKLNTINEYLVNEFEENREGAIALAKNNLNNVELFLMNGFKAMFSAEIVTLISNWLKNKFTIIYRADSMQVTQKLTDPKNEAVYIENTINEAAKLFGISSNDLGYVADEENKNMKLCSIFKRKVSSAAIPAELFESYGTIRFVNMFPLIVNTLLNGGILIVDEFDASIHPMALMNIVNIFHNDEINKNHAQLVFNTHNPIFLNSNLFRRDEIKFVEREDENHFSTHYSLSDFGTAGESGVRNSENYMKNYFIDRYGAIKDIDFIPIFKKLVENKKEV